MVRTLFWRPTEIATTTKYFSFPNLITGLGPVQHRLFFATTVMFRLGKTSVEKLRFLSGIVRKGGGFTHARICWSFFRQVIVPKIDPFLFKSHNNCSFFGHFFHNYLKISIITIILIIKKTGGTPEVRSDKKKPKEERKVVPDWSQSGTREMF